ncbi:MAG: VOC family protein [Rhodospirillaceae bacterium]|nr:VOC family protein [Rhodospirillaceae bacterium]MDE0618012.1 VOC family protein [Rhodospirillaceae bacterium]
MTADYRYSRLGYVALNVTDLERTLAFYTDIVGLDATEIADGQAALRCGPDHHNVLLNRAPEPGLKRIGFELESEDDLERAFRHLERCGYAPAWLDGEECAALHQGPGLRFRHPGTGLPLEYFIGMERMAEPFGARLARIARLGHVVVSTPDLPAMRDSLMRDLGFVLSDEVDGMIAFLRCFPNPFHHSLGIARADENRLHHVNFMVTDIDDVGRALNRLKKNKVEIVYGPGRHPPSGSIFLYFLDPDGMTVEYSFGMEEFAETGARAPRLMPPVPESLDFWSGLPSLDFARVGRYETAG